MHKTSFSLKFSTKQLALWGMVLFAVSAHAQLAVNEFNSKRGFTDETGEDVDWIEVFNYATDSVFLADYFLSDNPNNLDKWQFPNTYLGSQELITICASGKENGAFPSHWEALVVAENIWKYWTGSSPPPNYNDWNQSGYNDQNWNSGQGGIGYGDNDDNTTIAATPSILMRKEFQIVDVLDITHLLFHADYDDGFIAYLNGVEIMRSDNFANSSPSYNEFTTYDKEAVMYDGGMPESQLFDTDEVQNLLQSGTNVLAVRVHNASANSSDMSSNFFLSAGIASMNINYQSLPTWIQTPLVLPHAGFKLSHGETIFISDSNEIIVDSVYIPYDITRSISRGRLPDGTGNWCYFNAPSPNESNSQNTCYSGITETPVLDLASGWYSAAQQVTVTTPNNATSYYTINGDVPDRNDTEVNGPIFIYNTSVLSVRTFSDVGQKLPSAVVDRTYIIDEDNHGLPVVSIITTENHLWDWDNGIYVMGPGASTNYPYFGSNFWQPWSKKSRMEFFDGTQTKQFEAVFDLEIHGGWSRAEPQKSFRIDAKSKYTGDIEYPLIERKPQITSYNNFNLRNGGQHSLFDRIQDAVMSRLSEGTSIDRMGYQACIVYLNGAYWGLYGIREKFDEHYVESNHGVDKDAVQLLNREGALVGEASHFVESHQIITSTSTSAPNFVEVLSTRFDLENYIDYFVFETYIQNRDWMGIDWELNNIKLWRQDTLGATWRYMMYDTDFAFGLYGGNIYQNYIDKARNPSYPNQHSQIFDHILDNADFRCRFANRYDDLINTTFQVDRFNAVTDELKSELAPAIPDHVANWSSQMGPNSYSYWLDAVNGIKSYNSARIATARQHLNQSLSLQGQRAVDLAAYPLNSGHIQLNSITPELPWDGIYHGGCPITAQAIPSFGFIFSHWYSNATDYNNALQDSINVVLAANTTLVAHFDSCKNVVEGTIQQEERMLKAAVSIAVTDPTYEWFYNGILVSTDSVIYNPLDGNYQLTVRFDSCEIQSEVASVNNGEYGIHLFPNPAVDALTVQFLMGQPENMTLAIYNTAGQLVWESNYTNFVGQFNTALDVSTFARDLYFLRITTPTKTYARKFILID